MTKVDAPTKPLLAGLLRLFAYLPRRRRWQGWAVFAMMVVGGFAELLTIGAVLPFLALIADPLAAEKYPALQSLLDAMGFDGRDEALVGIAACFALVAVAAAAIRVTLAGLSQTYVYRIGNDLGVALYSRVLSQSYAFHVSQNSSTILSVMNKVQQILLGLFLPLMQAVTALIVAVFILTALLLVNAPVALAAGGVFGTVYLGISRLTRRALQANGAVIATDSTLRTKSIQEGLGGIRDVIIDQSQPVYVAKFDEIDTRLRKAQAANALLGVFPRYLIESLGMVLIAGLALLLLEGPNGLAGALPTLGALAIGAQRLLPLLQQTYAGWASILGNRAAFADVLAVLEQPLPAGGKQGVAVRPLPFQKMIALQGVDFRYKPSGPAVLRDISLTIPKGARIGFVGRTGSGKSTATDLIMGLIAPTAGAIWVDGVRLGPDNVSAWQKHIAHVPQSIYLSDASILENIAFGVPRSHIDLVRVQEAARKADVDTFVASLPDGYDTPVGERGIQLSGGQRQRLGIARALYKKATVLILDEATSALDGATEAAVMEAVEGLGRDLTILIIAHRTTTLRGCDSIYELDGGALTRCGKYDALFGYPAGTQSAVAAE